MQLSANLLLIGSIILSLNACGELDTLPISAGMGSTPTLPTPKHNLIPTLKIAPAIGWPAGIVPATSQDISVVAFASGLNHPRWLYVLPNGDVLVAETNASPKQGNDKSIKGWIMRLMMKKAGASVLSANRITLLRDANGDGNAEFRSIFLENLKSPFGMALIGNKLYVANSNEILQFPYTTGDINIKSKGVQLLELPAGQINHHWTKNLIADVKGKNLYVTIGSNSNVGENGIQVEAGRAAIWEVQVESGSHRIFASGLRNPNGLAWEPSNGTLYTVVNERDELGNNLVPDYLTSVQDGGFYGWPYSYYGQNIDKRVKPQNPEMVSKAIIPDYALGAHTASLGLTFSSSSKISKKFENGVFIGQHGSWNRDPISGYKVIFVPFVNGKPSGDPIDVLTGFISKNGDAYGRPVGVTIDKKGALLVADDVGNVVWHVASSKSSKF
jgi:glucose/arabinose dehydrogenase